MSKYPQREAFKPRTQQDHRAEDCDEGMCCDICMGRCYDGSPGHLFKDGEEAPCDCGLFSTVNAAQEFYERA